MLSLQLRSLPPTLIEQLREAALEGRAGRLEALADQVGHHSEEVAAVNSNPDPGLRVRLARVGAATGHARRWQGIPMNLHARSASVLVVEDTIENLRLLSELLGGQGYEVRAVTNGRQAIQAVEREPPDLILLDINMPELNGYEVCRHLKAQERSKDVPVIFITALTDTVDKVRAFDAGGVDYVTKPFQVEEVLARVQTHVALRRAQAGLADS